MTPRLYTGLFIAIIFAASCADGAEYYLDQSLEPFFLDFQEEAAKRGVIVDYESLGVEGFLANITEENVVGQCSHTEKSPNAVTIDPVFWKKATKSRKEFVIFHELGHCYLRRSHLDTSDEYGICISMMHSTAELCHADYESNRDRYLDELFSI